MIDGSPDTPFSAMPDRPKLRLPLGEKVIVWTIVNVENWALDRAMPRKVLPPPMGDAAEIDRANWSWHEYGLRVGFWRMLDLFKRFDVPVTLAINGSACEQYPRIVEAAIDADWEFMGHGYEQRPMQQLEDEAAAIGKTIDIIRAATGRAPRGWESPGLTGTVDTLELLAAAGIEYVSDLVFDEQPCQVMTRNGPLISLPYTVELNDVVLHAVQSQPSPEIWRRGLRQFRQLGKEGADSVRVMSISLHPYLTGVPHRFEFLERLYKTLAASNDAVFMSGGSIVDWYRTAGEGSNIFPNR